MVWGLMDLGELAHGQGDYEPARRYLQESVAISREMGYTNGLAFSLDALGCVVGDMGDYHTAADCFQECLAMYRSWDNALGAGWSLAMLGYIALWSGQREAAAVYLQDCHQAQNRAGWLTRFGSNLGWWLLAGFCLLSASSAAQSLLPAWFGTAEISPPNLFSWVDHNERLLIGCIHQ